MVDVTDGCEVSLARDKRLFGHRLSPQQRPEIDGILMRTFSTLSEAQRALFPEHYYATPADIHQCFDTCIVGQFCLVFEPRRTTVGGLDEVVIFVCPWSKKSVRFSHVADQRERQHFLMDPTMDLYPLDPDLQLEPEAIRCTVFEGIHYRQQQDGHRMWKFQILDCVLYENNIVQLVPLRERLSYADNFLTSTTVVGTLFRGLSVGKQHYVDLEDCKTIDSIPPQTTVYGHFIRTDHLVFLSVPNSRKLYACIPIERDADGRLYNLTNPDELVMYDKKLSGFDLSTCPLRGSTSVPTNCFLAKCRFDGQHWIAIKRDWIGAVPSSREKLAQIHYAFHFLLKMDDLLQKE